MKTVILGLTGSIGMGKTTTANMFLNRGVPVWDADSTVHRLYKTDMSTIDAFLERIPEVVIEKQVCREALKRFIEQNTDNLKIVEKIIHPRVSKEREEFISRSKKKNTPLVILDIPLLFETGKDKIVDYVAVVTVDKETQKNRVLDRNTMDEKMFKTILSKQMPDEEKQKKADFVILTESIKMAQKQVDTIISKFTDY